MTIVVGLDVHRAQIIYDALNAATGEVTTGRIAPTDRTTLRRWTGEQVEAAVEATTGWRFVVEELQPAGAACNLPSRPTRAWHAARSDGPRPTSATRATCATC
jgi:hypothetical protein